MSNFKRSLVFALNGIAGCFKKEAHFKIHVVSTVLTITAGIFFRINQAEWLFILGCIASVLATELINTAIEELCNIVHKEKHPGIKLVKDMAAAAVLIMAIMALLAAAIIFIPKIFSLLTSNNIL